MGNKTYTASVIYNEQTIQSFCKVQFSAFKAKRALAIMAVAFLLIFFGVSGVMGLVGAAITVPIGCCMLAYPNSIAKNNADKITKSFNGHFPKSSYRFDSSGFSITSQGQKNRIDYDSIIRLSEDKNYLHFFGTPSVAYTIDKSTLSGNLDAFKDFTSKKVGLEWLKYRAWYNVNIKELRRAKKNTKTYSAK